MQSTIQKDKPFYFNNYKFLIKLILLIVGCFLFACSRQKNIQPVLPVNEQIQTSAAAVNINTASVEELEKLPHVGLETAREIVEYRQKFGKFRRPEQLMLVGKISDRQFREMKNFVKVE